MEPGSITVDQAMGNPQKYFGYPEFSKFLAVAPNFPMLRRFDKLVIRDILRLQDEISIIEQRIDNIDDEMMKPNGQDSENNGTLRHDRSAERQLLLRSAYEKLDIYHRFVHKYAQLRDWPEPTDRDVSNIRDWIDWNTQWDGQGSPENTRTPKIRPIEEQEVEFLEAPDLLAIVPEKRSPLRYLFERDGDSYLSRWYRKEVPRSLKSSVEDGGMVLTDDNGLDRLDKIVTGLIGLLMLVGPLWSIQLVQTHQSKVGVITSFIFVCFVLVLAGTNIKPGNALGVTTGYAAVLMLALHVKREDI
ncbi:hypothetical protein ASPVEDRAFT_80315 [Aspergillus versicolor CBS 583.65]|uniref:DUF6594 domain-containing protein n=1 Tax=Aspergillus versicolor CBS 583.65 TaxID=1036611 RepID=A0A1L9PB45_ASPVE|nr:uncharacterized protein ASPVEDRAFT_80315 [Aspergillus versicolor CBS 583.65]OJI98675.1 hypothetical protein ASPVEDRAFT_80315 [Aspergillus versicolor CBS 583.65]